jgi:hypothetical protein
MRTLALTAVITLAGSSAFAVDFNTQIFPILNNKCAKCHSEKKGETKGKFAVDRKGDLMKGIKAGEPAKSSLVITVGLPADDEDAMPPKGKGTPLTPAEIGLLKQWITEGANFEAGGAAPAPAPAAAAGGAMSWTNTGGKALQAEFDRLEGDAVVLKMADGQYYKVPLASLSPESQAQAKKAAGQ